MGWIDIKTTEIKDAALACIGKVWDLPLFLNISPNSKLHQIIDALNTVHLTEIEKLRHKKVFFTVEANSLWNDYKVRSVGASAGHRATFYIPEDAVSVESIEMLGFIDSAAAGSGKSISLNSDYCTAGEIYNTHSESDTIVNDFTGLGDKLAAIDISSVFTNVEAGDVCGISYAHLSIGGYIRYAGIKVKYTV